MRLEKEMKDSIRENLKGQIRRLGVILYEKSLSLKISLFLLCMWANLRAIVAIHSFMYKLNELILFCIWSVSREVKHGAGNENLYL